MSRIAFFVLLFVLLGIGASVAAEDQLALGGSFDISTFTDTKDPKYGIADNAPFIKAAPTDYANTNYDYSITTANDQRLKISNPWKPPDNCAGQACHVDIGILREFKAAAGQEYKAIAWGSVPDTHGPNGEFRGRLTVVGFPAGSDNQIEPESNALIFSATTEKTMIPSCILPPGSGMVKVKFRAHAHDPGDYGTVILDRLRFERVNPSVLETLGVGGDWSDPLNNCNESATDSNNIVADGWSQYSDFETAEKLVMFANGTQQLKIINPNNVGALGIKRAFAASPGQIYQAEADSTIQNPQGVFQTKFYLSFLDSAGSSIGTPCGETSVTSGTMSTPACVAPLQTAKVRIHYEAFADSLTGVSGTAIVDEVRLTRTQ